MPMVRRPTAGILSVVSTAATTGLRFMRGKLVVYSVVELVSCEDSALKAEFLSFALASDVRQDW